MIIVEGGRYYFDFFGYTSFLRVEVARLNCMLHATVFPIFNVSCF